MLNFHQISSLKELTRDDPNNPASKCTTQRMKKSFSSLERYTYQRHETLAAAFYCGCFSSWILESSERKSGKIHAQYIFISITEYIVFNNLCVCVCMRKQRRNRTCTSSQSIVSCRGVNRRVFTSTRQSE